MTITISLSADAEARLRDRAAATGKDLPTLVREAVEEKLGACQPGNARDMPHDQWTVQFNDWMRDVEKRASNYPPGYVADDRRESIYEGRDE